MCSAQRKFFVIACVLDFKHFENMLQIFLKLLSELSNLPPIRYLPAQSNNKNTKTRCEICSKLTIKTPERHQLNSFQCLYCKLYAHFTTCLVFVLLTLNMQLFDGQLPSFLWRCERYIEKQPCEIVPKSSSSADFLGSCAVYCNA